MPPAQAVPNVEKDFWKRKDIVFGPPGQPRSGESEARRMGYLMSDESPEGVTNSGHFVTFGLTGFECTPC
ncbi:MAG: hypothetical protein R3C49_07465 [Planctomycetaceae bacterium]